MNSAMRKISIMDCARKTALLALPLCVLAACAAPQTSGSAPKTEAMTPETVAAPERVINYGCDDGRTVEVTLKGAERVLLKINGATAPLSAVRTPSGAKFQSADGSIVFWSQGSEATIETDSRGGVKTSMVCVAKP